MSWPTCFARSNYKVKYANELNELNEKVLAVLIHLPKKPAVAMKLRSLLGFFKKTVKLCDVYVVTLIPLFHVYSRFCQI